MMRLAIGIGCRRGVAGDAIVAFVRDTLTDASFAQNPASLFSIDAKRDETGICAAAETLAMPLTFLPRADLAGFTTPTISARSQEMFGVGSVAESAALAGAGAGARLVIRRVARDGVTCAIACAES